jgi:hypothetical protein
MVQAVVTGGLWWQIQISLNFRLKPAEAQSSLELSVADAGLMERHLRMTRQVCEILERQAPSCPGSY